MSDHIKVTVNKESGMVEVNISGRFDFGLHTEFHEVLEVVKVTPDAIVVVDLSAADYVDSSALGMLLLLKEVVGGDASKIKVVKCRPGVKEILEMANFHKMFSVT